MPAIKPYLTKKGEKRFMLQAYLGTDKKTGKRARVSRNGFLSERDALLEYSKLMLAFESDGLKKDEPIKYKALYEFWLANYAKTVKESTLKKTMDAFRLHILPALGKMYINKISVMDAQKAVNTWSDSQVNHRMIKGYASQIIQEAVRLGYADKNPFDLVVTPKRVAKEKPLNFYTKDELNDFLEHVKEEGTKWYTLFRVLAYTGMRKGEALALNWEDIDFKHATITINKTLSLGKKNQIIVQTPKTKTGKRTVSIDAGTLEALRAWKREQTELKYGRNLIEFKKNSVIFTTGLNSYIPLPQPGHVLDRVAAKHRLKRINIHGLRHTHCSLLFEAGFSIKEVQDRLGHSDIKTTMNIYAHVSQKKKDEIAQKFAEFLAN